MVQYKDSGIKWIGKIPSDWTSIKSKYVFNSDKEIAGIRANNYDRLALTLNGVIHRSKDDAEGLQPTDFFGYQIVQKDNLILKLIDLQNISTSRIGLSKYEGIVSPAYIILKCKSEMLPGFAEKFYYAMWMNNIFNDLGDSGVRSALTKNDLLDQYIVYPNINMQRKIANFLDNKCQKIDEVSSLIEKQIEKLNEYKKSLIYECVTKGLDKNVQYKDSGIKWIGKIPENWTICKIGSFFNLRTTKVNDIDYMPLSVTMKGILPQLETAAKSNSHEDRKLVRKGDFVINSRSDRRGSCGISPYDGSVSLINTVLSPKININSSYFNWLFHSDLFSQEFYKWGHGIVNDLWTTRWQDMKNILVPTPSLSCQNEISDYLDKKCQKIDDIVNLKKKQLEKMEQYKKSLIYECVTGKREV